MRVRQVVVALTLGAAALAGCDSTSDDVSSQNPDAVRTDVAGNPSPFDYFPVGSTATYFLGVHCGLEFTSIDGMTWRTHSKYVGDTNAPAGWRDTVRGTLTRPTFARAVFTANVGTNADPVTIQFEPAPGITFTCA